MTLRNASKVFQSPAARKRELMLANLLRDSDPLKAISSGKIMAREWAKQLQEPSHLLYAQSFIYNTIRSYWVNVHNQPLIRRPLPNLNIGTLPKLDDALLGVSEAIGNAASKLDILEAGFQLGSLYTIVLPEKIRKSNGVFYTPPALTERLLNLSEKAGVKWASATVLDPACGGGAFLAPVALRMVKSLKSKKAPADILGHISSHLRGYEIDEFAAWLTQVFVEVALKDVMTEANAKIGSVVTVCDSLNASNDQQFDLVIGNPPYGKIKLTEAIKNSFKESLYGHPNYYGLFSHLATNLVKPNGVISYLTPTSFLSGEYFKNLRSLLRTRVSPVEIDFVSFRKGVFEDVLQETMLTIYKREVCEGQVKVSEITTKPEGQLETNAFGSFALPKEKVAPWILPKTKAQVNAVQAMSRMSFVLKDWGYRVSTGPLVWNRYKSQFSSKKNKNAYPVLWAEAVSPDGIFRFKAEKKNHEPFFLFQPGDEWLVTNTPCVLLQRTTAKEQDKRLIAAVLPTQFLEQHGGAIVENHLNMIIPISPQPAVDLETLSAFLNSRAANNAFRTISGSVAVSAYELESMPLPDVDQLSQLSNLVAQNSDSELVEQECAKLFNSHK